MAHGGGGLSSGGVRGGVNSIPVAQEGEMYCLKWHTFQSHFTKGLKALFMENDEAETTDVTLGAEGRYIRAHRWLLSLCSPYFKNLFKTSPNKQANHVVILNQVKFKDLENLVHFMYNGEVRVSTNSELQGFLQIGGLLEVEGLARCDAQADSVPPPSASTSHAVPSTSKQESVPKISNTAGPSVVSQGSLAKGAVRSSPAVPSTSFKKPPESNPSTSCPPLKRRKVFPENQTLPGNVLPPIVTMPTQDEDRCLEYPDDSSAPLEDPLAFDHSAMDEGDAESQETLATGDSLHMLQRNNETDEPLIDIQPFIKNERAYVGEEAPESDDDEHDSDKYYVDPGESDDTESFQNSRIHVSAGLSDRPGPSSQITGRTASAGTSSVKRKERSPKSKQQSKRKDTRSSNCFDEETYGICNKINKHTERICGGRLKQVWKCGKIAHRCTRNRCRKMRTDEPLFRASSDNKRFS